MGPEERGRERFGVFVHYKSLEISSGMHSAQSIRKQNVHGSLQAAPETIPPVPYLLFIYCMLLSVAITVEFWTVIDLQWMCLDSILFSS